MDKINEIDWLKLQLAEARSEIAQLKLDSLKKDLVMAYNIQSTDKVSTDGSITRHQVSEESIGEKLA